MGVPKILGNDAESVEKRDALGIHYLGLSLALAWFYCLWFSPKVFISTPLMGRAMIYSWLASLAASAITFLVAPIALRHIKIYEHPAIVWVCAATLSIGTLAFTILKALATPIMIWIVFPLVFAIANTLIWSAWGEFHARKRSAFTLRKFALVYGTVMLVCMTMTEVLPAPLSNVFVALIPIVCALVYKTESASIEELNFPAMLPKAIRKKTDRCTLVMSMSLCLACVACYFTVAIVPEENILTGDASYPVGMTGAALLCIVIAIAAKASKRTEAAYKLLPYFMVAAIVALALFASRETSLDTISFTLCVILAGIFEVFVISYFGTLSTKGYFTPIVAFCASSAIVRLGFTLGEFWAVLYEDTPTISNVLVNPTALLLICVVAAALIPLVRNEGEIVRLTTAPTTINDLGEVCDAVIAEFKLSNREGEILKLVARGYTVDNISKKLVISPYTTQTHIRHIYAKMNVHKRSELLDYINMHRDSEQPTPPPESLRANLSDNEGRGPKAPSQSCVW